MLLLVSKLIHQVGFFFKQAQRLCILCKCTTFYITKKQNIICGLKPNIYKTKLKTALLTHQIDIIHDTRMIFFRNVHG